MSKALELLLKKDFRRLFRAYIDAFPYSYAKHRGGPVDFQTDLATYDKLINANWEKIVRAAAWGISGYSNLYKVMPKDGFDAFKTIYFLGRAIERQLLAVSHVHIAQVHMFSMIGLLDTKLGRMGISKIQLTGAMTSLVRLSEFDAELGKTGLLPDIQMHIHRAHPGIVGLKPRREHHDTGLTVIQ